MAKGNIFLGMGRGSVGDVTFYRGNGQQLSRVRNRKPRNPKTPAQLYQRAIMATVVAAYQAGKQIFDHSFEGFSKGAQNQREFISRNTKMLRNMVAVDLNSNLGSGGQKSRVTAPKVSTPVGLPWVISRGSYPQGLFKWDADNNYFSMPSAMQPGVEDRPSVAEYADTHGIIPGDIYTFVAILEMNETLFESPLFDDALSMVRRGQFRWLRMTVKSDVFDDNDVINTLGQLFDFTTDGSAYMFTPANKQIDLANFQLGDFCKPSDEYTVPMQTGAFGVIRSRFDQDLRSDSYMHVIYGNDADTQYGIVPEYLLDIWKGEGGKLGSSDLILEGGGI